MTVTIGYYAAFREQSGRSRETIETDAVTALELYEGLRSRHGFTLPAAVVRVAIHQEFHSIDAPLSDGVEIVFIPPVAGG